jgi:hypothetical protein
MLRIIPNIIHVQIHRIIVPTAIALYLALMVGCGERLPPTAAVHGKVTVGGRAVGSGQITFLPVEGRPATATINPDGSYRLTTFRPNDGAVLGKHKVTIQATRITGVDQPKSFEEELQNVGKSSPGNSAVQWIVPEKYARAESTPLTADVKAGENAIDFDL